MARPVDPALRAARRSQIIDAGLTTFAQYGPAATTAQICATAGIASGTFFHHFPTKDALVVAILEQGMADTGEFFGTRRSTVPPLEVITDFVDHSVTELTDPRAAGLIRAVAGMMHRPAIAQTLETQAQQLQHALALVISSAQDHHLVREDLAARRLAAWVLLIIDGYTNAVASGSIDAGRDAVLLHDQIRALLERRY